MTKEEKYALVAELTEVLNERPNVYITETGGLSVQQANNLRRMCFEAGIEVRVVKNTLLRKAMEATGRDYSGVFPTLKEQSSVFFVNEAINAPAKLIKSFRQKNAIEKPVLKSAFVDEAVFVGDENLNTLETLKSKEELVADIIALLQGSVHKVLGQLGSGGSTIHGLLKTLEERNA